MRRVSGVIAILAVIFAASHRAADAQVQAVETPRGISVTGTAEVHAMPDIAYITLGVRNRSSKAEQAASENAAAVTKTIQAIRQLRIAESDIETVQYTLQPVFEYPPNQQPKLTGYEAANMVRVTVRNLALVGRVIDAGVSAGANEVQNISFALENEANYRATAITQAVQDGRAKAATMAKALGVRLGKLLNASESTSPIVYPMLSRAEAAMGGAETPISPEQVVVRATVSLVYLIEP
ncbi:MAG: SIMPL domain-containing protein [Armatimonadota bacterium]